MLIGLMSDSHDNMPLIRKAVDLFNQKKVGLVLHAGDIVAPFCANELSRLNCKMMAVFGNNDGEKKVWREKIQSFGQIFDTYYEAEINGFKTLMMHEPYQLDSLAAGQKYDILVYGHTHKADVRISGKTLIVNPGECGGWLTGKPTVGLLSLPKKSVEIINLI